MKCPCPRHPLPRSTHTSRLNISLRKVLNTCNNVPGEVLLTKQSTVKSLIKIHDWYWHDFNYTCFEQNLVIIYMQRKLPWWFRIQYMWSRYHSGIYLWVVWETWKRSMSIKTKLLLILERNEQQEWKVHRSS